MRNDISNSGTNGRIVLAATILGSSMAFIDGTVVNVALPALQNALHASIADVQWVVASYALLLAALLLVGGSLGDTSVGVRSILLALPSLLQPPHGVALRRISVCLSGPARFKV